MSLEVLAFLIKVARVLIYFIWFMMGATVFSFLNVVIYRLPEHKNLVKGRSMCRKCGHDLNVWDTIPVFSWIFLGGKCRYCKEKISLRYLMVELMGGISAVGLVLYYGASLAALTVFAFFAVMTVISFIDYDTMIIPPQLNVMIFLIGVVSIWTMGGPTLVERIIGMFAISLPLYIIIMIVPNGFGGGDIKLMFAAGFMLGWKATVAAFFIGLVLGGAYGIYLMARRKKGKSDHFAFGPFLCIGLAVALFYGEAMVNAYLGSFSAL
ncbi:MAG: prepilin peptidase [Lachnospiraceae bacterium]